jgi:hypothetical protein
MLFKRILKMLGNNVPNVQYLFGRDYFLLFHYYIVFIDYNTK